MTSNHGQPPKGSRSRIRTATGIHQTPDPAQAAGERPAAANIPFKSNTTPIVDAIGHLDFRGVVIPHSWFKHIRTIHGAPHPLAVMILADIIHYYKPTEKYDFETGRLTVHKKFRGQKLQRRNAEYAKMFGYSKSQVLRAVHQLVELGLITQEIVEQMMVGEVVYNNVQYLEPVPERVAEITRYSPDLEAYLSRQRHLRENTRPISQLHRDTTPVVDAIERINLTGNVLPPMWFKHVKTEKGNPHLLAVMILAELIYWYRPDVKRDPDTLEIVEINKRFDGAKYRMRNTSYAQYLGVSHDQVYRAIHRLADLGYITQELDRNEGNVQYVEPVPERIEYITFVAPAEAGLDAGLAGLAVEIEAVDAVVGEGEAENPEDFQDQAGGLRADAPGLRASAPPLRVDTPGLRTHAPGLRAHETDSRAAAPDLTRQRTTNTKTSDTRISPKISSKTSPTISMRVDDDGGRPNIGGVADLDDAQKAVFTQLESLLAYYKIDGVNRTDIAHRLAHRAGQIDGPGEWQPMVYRIANCWRKCFNLHKIGRVGDAEGFTGFFIYKLRGMDSEYVAQAGEIDEGRARHASADSVALARQVEQALMSSQSTVRSNGPSKANAKASETSRSQVDAKAHLKPMGVLRARNGLTQLHPGQAERSAFAKVQQSLMSDEGLTHLTSLLTRLELIASDGVQFVVSAPDSSQVSLSTATLELIIANRLEDMWEGKGDTLDVRVLRSAQD